MSKSPITIINDENMRGIIAPVSAISEEMLEDFIDMVEMSSPESMAEDERRIKEADDAGSWIPYAEVRKRARKAR